MRDDEPGDTEVRTGVTHREGVGPRASEKRKAEHYPRGHAIGRYLVLDILGEGGMGVVYAAYDPELDRKVAIKLMQATSSGSHGQAWLLREAQALARLSHPNVIEVHDVGTLPNDRVFVAMALADGKTLRIWMKDKHPWRDTIAVLCGAGAGLAAAHAVGLVHRDFKPDNVQIGTDGRARLMDFGLARLTEDAEPSAPAPVSRISDRAIEVESPLHASLTAAGSLPGTPAYMAPELYDGKPADARTDQFAFGVTLYEALYRARPFEKAQLVAERTSPPVPKKPPAEAGVPARIERAVLRAIAADPAQRHPSMDALLAELAIDPAAARRRVLYATGAIVAIGAAATVGFVASRGEPAVQTADLCTGAPQRMVDIWDATVAAQAGSAFEGKRPFAARTFEVTKRALDGYRDEWITAATDNCKATRVRGEQSEEVFALREACLDDRLAELHEVTRLVRTADAPLVDRADRIAATLEPVRRCNAVAELRAPSQPPPELAAKLPALRSRMAVAKALYSVGRYPLAVEASTPLVAEVRAFGYAPALAEVLTMHGSTLVRANKIPEGTAVLAEAAWVALRARRDDLVALAALTQASTVATAQGKPAEAEIWLGLAGATIARGGEDKNLERQRLEVEGTVAGERGDMVAARAAHEKARALAEITFGKDGAELWRSEQLLAATYAKGGAWGDAIPHFERALALREVAVGPDHPDCALVLTSLGAAYAHVGDSAKVATSYARALAIRETVFGKDSPQLAATLNNLADFALQRGDLVAALAHAERARAIAEAKLGMGHPVSLTVATTVGEIQLAAGKLAEARATLDATIAREDNSPILATTLTARAQVSIADARWAEAIAFATRAIVAMEAAGGKDSADLWRPLAVLGRALIAQRKLAEAKVALARAIAIGERAKVKTADLEPFRAALAKLP